MFCVPCDCRFSSRIRRKTEFFSLIGEEEGEKGGRGKGRSKKVPSKVPSAVRRLSFEPHSKTALVAPPPYYLTAQNSKEDGGPWVMDLVDSQEKLQDHTVVCVWTHVYDCKKNYPSP